MTNPIRIGTKATLTFTVTDRHVIDFSDDVMPAVLSTPWLIWFLEHAAREAVLPLLEAGESTVGARVEVEHLAPATIGQRVTCQARVIFVDRQLISFEFKAWDDKETLAKGTHKLRVIQKARLAERLRKK